ncbi:hypothetical protein R4J00_07170 [Brachyspira intermedia]|uniref:hypothetical protein n=1 Tax=Brachyspira intermedia TaxID=84377 RepID=UPI003005AF17
MKLKNVLEKYYSKDFSNQLYDILMFNYEEYVNNSLQYIQETRLFNYLFNKTIELDNTIKEYNNINAKIEKLINSLAWWIPIKKWRDNFRNKILNKD